MGKNGPTAADSSLISAQLSQKSIQYYSPLQFLQHLLSGYNYEPCKLYFSATEI